MADLKGLGLEFTESMSGWIGKGKKEYIEGRISGQRKNTPIQFSVKITIDDLDHFINLSNHNARLTGTVSFEPLGNNIPIEDGRFNLFSVDPDEEIRHMTYSFRFSAEGKKYFLHGHKKITDDPGFDLMEDMTTLFATIFEGTDETCPVYGSGQLFFNIQDAPALLASMKVNGTWWLHRKIQAKMAFMSFAWGAVRQEYLRDVNPLYDTEYENLVLSGKVSQDGQSKDFFLVSGIHDKDFPWGDGELFWDVMLIVGDGDGGYRRYGITNRVLEGLELNIKEGTYRYQGPIFELLDPYKISFSDMQRETDALVRCNADFEISFKADAYSTTPLPFLISSQLIAKLATGLKWMLRSVLPSEAVLGIFITPHTVAVNGGHLTITKKNEVTKLVIETDETFGEAERSSFRNIKEPTMLYGYICAVQTSRKTARVQIHANSLRNDRQRLIKDQIDAFLGAVISRTGSCEMLMENGEIHVTNIGPKKETHLAKAPLFKKLGEPLLEINNDHFPTADFLRRIVKVRDPSGEPCLALEEDMNFMKVEAENCTRETTIASIRNENKFRALDVVLEETAFMDLVEGKREASGLSKENFSVVIKPNFMFAYNKKDFTTFTDPELVGHLVKRLRDEGFENISVVEAQSTYGEYFTNRGVREVAEYLGYATDQSAGYRVVDLTEDEYEKQHLGPHLGDHPVPLTWKNADFRLSFAKNKTHAYSYFSLTLKNIYGALPLPDKFSEYHTGRDIYHTTMEYLRAFPVDYGLIDAYTSADGPFGVFADPEPNDTQTIIGGADLVAVDWVGASKMGLEPKISPYVELAVKTFGKPKIHLKGDPGLYRPWLNVPAALSLFAHFGLDANDYFGNLIYMVGAYMDEEQFQHKSKSAFIRAARHAMKPIQETFFLQAGGEKSYAARFVSKFFTWLGSQ